MFYMARLYPIEVQSVPLPGANRFKNQRRQNANQCRIYGISSRLATSASVAIDPSNPNDSEKRKFFEESLNCIFEKKTTTKKFKHACLGTYRGNTVYHYYDPNTKLNVMVDRNTNKFISGWKLSREQQTNMQLNGNIQ